ncbi:choice-of-anchor D domain-containing protein [Silvibacterium dinghuense]|nr:choice-of-anchor D domain-containing protein [Silvibacterium dinghuense]
MLAILAWVVLCGVPMLMAQQAPTPPAALPYLLPPVLGNAALARLQAMRFLVERGLTPGGRSPDQTLAAARRQQALSPRFSAVDAAAHPADASLSAAWQPVGPAQVSTASFGLVTGRVTALAADPADATGNTLYVGSTGGGVWKSTAAAGAANFAPLTDTLAAYSANSSVSLSIGALSVQPGGTGVVLAGTGDPNSAADSYYGAGILRSGDGGLTWSLIAESDDLETGGNNNYTFLGNSFAGFAWSTASPSTVVAAVSTSAEGIIVNAPSDATGILGLYYSLDAGKSWQLATITDGSGNVVQSSQMAITGGGNAATAVVWNPLRQLFFAAVRYHGYYQSPDGVTWTRMANQPGAALTTANCPTNAGTYASIGCPIFRGALAVQPVTGDLFALTVDQENQDQGLWRDVCSLSSNACANPVVQWGSQIADTALEAGNGDTTIPQAAYDLVLAAVPSQQDTLLFAGAYDLFRCSLANACAWRNTTNDQTCMAAGVAPAQHAIDATAAASGILYFGNDGGLWRTTDLVNQQQAACSSDDATHFQNLNEGLGSLAEVESMAEDETDSANLMASLGNLGTAAPQSGASAWLQVLDGYGSGAAIDPASTENWYATSEFGVGINRCTEGSGCNTAGFGSIVIGNSDVSGDGGTQLIPAPWILDPQNTSNIILGTCRIWRGPSIGDWSSSNLLSSMLDGDQGSMCNGNAEIRSLAASGSASDAAGVSEQVYAGLAGLLDGGESIPGHLFSASVNSASGASTSWTDLALSPVTLPASNSTVFNPGGFDISSIDVDAHDSTGNTVYVTVQGFGNNAVFVDKVYRSVDGGAHWQNLTSNLPNAPANSIAVDPNNANIVYVATDMGVYVTTEVSDCLDASDNCWSVFGTALPNAPAVQLAVYNYGATSVLRAATYGRGIWQIPLVSAATVQTTMSVTPASLNFASEAVSTQSAPQQLVVNNTGSLSLNISQITVTGDFSESDTCSSPIAPGDACVVEVYFLPAVTGARSGVLTLYANISSGQVTVPLSGTGLAAPSIILNPVQVDFPATTIGSTSPASNVTVSNTGGSTAALASETVSGDFSIAANTCGTTLTANTGCTVSLVFAPTASGTRTGTLTVVDSAGTQTAALTGTGQSVPTDTLSPASLAFAAQVIGTASAGQAVTLTNSGDLALQLIATQVSGAFQAINNCGTSLAGHASCAIVVQFVPQAVGSTQGTLTVSDALRVQTINLTGAGVAPAGISATPVSLSFGNYAIGATSPPQTVTVTNNGGIGLSALQYAVTGDFALASTSGGCGSSLGAGSACQLSLTFSPTQAGARSGQLTITAAELSSPLEVALSGSGEDFSLQVSGSSTATITSGQTASYLVQVIPVNGSTGTVSLSCAGAPVNATCVINPATVALNANATASATVTVETGVADTAMDGRSRALMPRASPLLLAVALPWLAVRRRKTAPAARRMLSLLALFVLFLAPVACGVSASGGSGGAGGGGTTSGNSTPSGTYTLTVTGSAPGVTHTASLTLTVE